MFRRVRSGAVQFLLTVAPAVLGAQASANTFFVPRDAALAAGFLGAAAGLSVFDRRIERSFQDTTNAHVRWGRATDKIFTRINESTLTVGGLLAWGIGTLAHAPAVADIGLHTSEAVAGASITSQLIRGPLGRSRPERADYDDPYDFHWFQGFTHFDYRSFPSIHSSSAFAAASVWVAETQYRAPRATWIVAPLAYSFALTPGLARMYLGEHWASDIFAGAFMGTFYGWRVVRYTHTHSTPRLNQIFSMRGNEAPPLSLEVLRFAQDGGLRLCVSPRRELVLSWAP